MLFAENGCQIFYAVCYELSMFIYSRIVLDYVLNKNGDKRKYKPVSELSLDARALHDQLPDLDYMLSNVLLFPIVDR